MKERILALISKAEEHVSGEYLAKELGISRTAVWKHIKQLKAEGYEIEAVRNRGYRLRSFDSLRSGDVLPHLQTTWLGRSYEFFESVGSTNDYLKEHLNRLPEGHTAVAEEQLKGRGRVGRSWSSPKAKGLWFSLLLRPAIGFSELAPISLIAAAAVYRGLSEQGIETQIKWPNDLVIRDRKVAGILIELVGEADRIGEVILGIGINVNLEEADLPEELRATATSLFLESGKKTERRYLLSSILKHLETFYEDFRDRKDTEEVIRICREHSSLIGRNAVLLLGDRREPVDVLGLDESGNLIVRETDGTERTISYGEISIRPLE